MDSLQRILLPTVIAFWLVMGMFHMFSQTHPQIINAGGFVFFLTQVLFDAAACLLTFKIVALIAPNRKFLALCFAIALLGLTLSDFFYNASQVGFIPLSVFDLAYFDNLPQLGFYVFMLIGFGRLLSVERTESEHPSSLLLKLLAFVVLVLFIAIFFFSTSSLISVHTPLGALLAAETVAQALGVFLALLVMARASHFAVNYTVCGFILIVLSNFLGNIGLETGVSFSGPMLETFWMLGSILLATGAYIRVRSLK
jgi:hypothetical protein